MVCDAFHPHSSPLGGGKKGDVGLARRKHRPRLPPRLRQPQPRPRRTIHTAAAIFTTFMEWVNTQPADTYAEYALTRERWLAALTQGQNPFDEATLVALMGE